MAGETGMRLFWVQLALLIPSLVCTGLRIYVRAFMARAFSADDAFIVLATAIFVASSSVNMRGATAGAMGQAKGHDASVEKLSMSLKGIYICQALYPPLSLAIRVSVCLFLLRIVHKKLHRLIIHALLALVSAVSIGYFLTTVFQCVPPSYFWHRMRSEHRGSCIGQEKLRSVALVHGAVSVLSAWVVGLLPVVILWDVRMNRRTKGTVATLLGIGFLAGIIIVVRMATLKSYNALSKEYFKATMRTALWSMIEPGVGIIAASLPTLRPLFKKPNPSVSRANKAFTSAKAEANHRPRGPERTPHWLELTTRDAPDEELGKLDSDGSNSASAKAEDSRWNTWIERDDDFQLPPLGAITIHTAIEVTSKPRDLSVRDR